MEHTHIENVKNFSTENSRVLTSDYVNKLNAIYCMQIILNEIYLVIKIRNLKHRHLNCFSLLIIFKPTSRTSHKPLEV